MANTSPVYARIDSGLKENAEGILEKLGISPSSAIQMLYSQIVLLRGMPFEVKIPPTAMFTVDGMTPDQFNAEIQKGTDSIKAGRTHSAAEVDSILTEEYGI